MGCWVIEQLDKGTAGESEKQHGHGGVGVDGFVELFCAACVSGAAWLGLLAFLLEWGRYMSLFGGVGGVVWLGCETGTVLGDTAVHLPGGTWGASHTPDNGLA